MLLCKCYNSKSRARKALSSGYSGFGKSKDASILWNCGIYAVLWGIWTERNSRMFRDQELPLHLLWDRVVYMASLWGSAKGAFCGISISDLQRDWSAAVIPNYLL